jgi:antitoxin HicB
MKKNKHVGSPFDDFLKEEGIRDQAHVQAAKRMIAWQIAQKMAEQKLSKNQMVKRMKTSRTQVERLLDPENDKVQLNTLQRAAAVIGRSLRLELA